MVKKKKRVVFMPSKVIVREVQQVIQKEEQSENEGINKEFIENKKHSKRVKDQKNWRHNSRFFIGLSKPLKDLSIKFETNWTTFGFFQILTPRSASP